jgi:hypothetical protein
LHAYGGGAGFALPLPSQERAVLASIPRVPISLGQKVVLMTEPLCPRCIRDEHVVLVRPRAPDGANVRLSGNTLGTLVRGRWASRRLVFLPPLGRTQGRGRVLLDSRPDVIANDLP